jgi:hypothetical protein
MPGGFMRLIAYGIPDYYLDKYTVDMFYKKYISQNLYCYKNARYNSSLFNKKYNFDEI